MPASPSAAIRSSASRTWTEARVDDVVNDELRRAADEAGSAKAPQALVDVGAIRERLLRYGWVKDARILRRLPDTLVIDIVERKPAALWQSQGQLALIDSEGVVLDRVPVDRMPDLPLLIGPGANGQEKELSRLMADVPTLKPQLASATWVGGPALGPQFQSGETVALPEGYAAARAALDKFAKDGQAERIARPRDGPLRPPRPRQDDRPLPHAIEPAKPVVPPVG